MNDKIKSELMLIAGCLHDIAEKSKEEYTSKQITEVQERLERLIEKVTK